MRKRVAGNTLFKSLLTALLLGPVFGSVVLSGGVFAVKEPASAVQSALSTHFDDPKMKTVTEKCLDYVASPALKTKLNVLKVLNVYGYTKQYVIDWLVNGTPANSRQLNPGFLTIIAPASADVVIDGTTYSQGDNIQVGIPAGQLPLLRGCLLSEEISAFGDGAILATKLANNAGWEEVDAATLLGEINLYRTSSGQQEPEDYSDDGVDVAPTPYTNKSGGGTNPSLGSSSQPKLFEYVYSAIDIISILIGVVLVGSTIFAGIQYTTAAADSSKVQKAKGRLASNVVVLALYIFSATILNWILPG